MSSKQRSTFVRRLLCAGWIALLAASGLRHEPAGPGAGEAFQAGQLPLRDRGRPHGKPPLRHGPAGVPDGREPRPGEPQDPVRSGRGLHAAGASRSRPRYTCCALLEIYPEYHDARLHLSGLYLVLERYPEAADQARILADDPTFPAAWRALTNLAVAELRASATWLQRAHTWSSRMNSTGPTGRRS